LTASRVTFAGTNGRLVDSSAMTFNSGTGALAVTGSVAADNLTLDGNTISSTDTDGDIILDPNGNGSVEIALANTAGSVLEISGPTASQYKTNMGTNDNSVPNKLYVDEAVSTASSNAALDVTDGTSAVTVNLTDDDLVFVGTNDISVSLARGTGEDANKVTFTISSEYDLDQDVGTTDSVTFAAVTVDNTTIDNNTITTTTGVNLTLTATDAEVIANSLTVSDLTETRVVFAGASGALVDSENFTFTTATGKLDVTGELEVDNVSINGNTIGTVDTNGKLTLSPNGTGVVEIDSDALTTTETTFNLVNATATTVNFAGAATTLSIGAGTGTTTINNANTVVTGDLAVNGGDLTTTETSFNLLNATATTVNFAGAGTAITIGASGSGTTTVRHDLAVSGDVAVNGGDLTTTATTFNLVNTTATTVNFAQGAAAVNIGAASSMVTFGEDVTITGDLIVNGTTTTINSTTLTIDDPLIKLADGNVADSLDIGFYGQFSPDAGVTTKFAGLFRDASDASKFKLFADGTVSDNVVTVVELADLVVGTLEGTIDGGTY
jgi:hypothetical protein